MLKSESKKNLAIENSSPNLPSPQVSLLGPSLKIKGEISGTQDLVVHGQVQGKINLEAHNLTVARSARIKADIRVKNVIIEGSLEGDVHATGKAIIESNGHMSGGLTAGRISIAEGAIFKGNLKILSSS